MLRVMVEKSKDIFLNHCRNILALDAIKLFEYVGHPHYNSSQRYLSFLTLPVSISYRAVPFSFKPAFHTQK